MPESNIARWLGKKATGGIPLVWLANFAHALRVDPVWFTRLPAIPEDPLAPYTLPENDPLLDVLDAARLARIDRVAEGEEGPLAEDPPPSPPRKRGTRARR